MSQLQNTFFADTAQTDTLYHEDKSKTLFRNVSTDVTREGTPIPKQMHPQCHCRRPPWNSGVHIRVTECF